MKADYLQLAYLQQTLGILRQNEAVLDQLIQERLPTTKSAKECSRTYSKRR